MRRGNVLLGVGCRRTRARLPVFCCCSTVKVDFLSISYRQLEKQVTSLAGDSKGLSLLGFDVRLCRQVADDVSVALERVCGTLEQESSRLTQSMGETIFELFISLKILKGFREFLPLKFVLSLTSALSLSEKFRRLPFFSPP